jgi:hypothetical protein
MFFYWELYYALNVCAMFALPIAENFPVNPHRRCCGL